MGSFARSLWLALTLFAGLVSPATAQPLDVQFLHCVPTSPGALEYTCSLAGPCTESPCLPTQWTPIDGVQSLPPSFFTPGGTRASAIQITRPEVDGVLYTMVNKDVGGQRWAIIQNHATGIVTGNVFTGAAEGGVHFIYCPGYTLVLDFVQLQCETALPCAAHGCDPVDWTGFRPVLVLASFFNPGGGRASALQVTPQGEEILISKDFGQTRWAITALADEQTEEFPLGIGPVFGNIFEVESEEPATVDSVVRANANVAHGQELQSRDLDR